METQFRFLGNNSLTGSLPDVKSSSLNNLYAKMIFSIAMIYSFHTFVILGFLQRFFVQPTHGKLSFMGYQ
jgi:hypothetical protein